MSDRLALALAELVEAIRAEVRAEAAPVGPERLLSVGEAAAMLGISRVSIYGEISAGRLQTIKVGRRRLVPAASIARFIAEGAE
jgi:excisionase family DNA binding protein